jgi:molybdenum cofactor guanylyltransferase
VPADAPVASVFVGIFVGGASRRMNGQPKGLLAAPDGRPIVERWRALCDAVGLRCVLVGDATAYAALGLASVADARADAGPLGGLVGLLRATTSDDVVALACDMPFVSAALLERLAFSERDAPALAPVRDGRFEPLFARYRRANVLPLAERQLASALAGDRSLQPLLRAAGARPLVLDDAEWASLADWDAPADVTR